MALGKMEAQAVAAQIRGPLQILAQAHRGKEMMVDLARVEQHPLAAAVAVKARRELQQYLVATAALAAMDPRLQLQVHR
jgi:hypothetical protein